jgi:hypothetical protein
MTERFQESFVIFQTSTIYGLSVEDFPDYAEHTPIFHLPVTNLIVLGRLRRPFIFCYATGRTPDRIIILSRPGRARLRWRRWWR